MCEIYRIPDLIEKIRIYGPLNFAKHAFNELRCVLRAVFLKSYSQRGEDLVIDRLLGAKRTGFYVDVGANDPERFSNTKRFYDRGWRGINIEPDIRKFNSLKKARPRDITLNLGIGLEPRSLLFFKFIPDTLSTFSSQSAKKYLAEGFKLVRKEVVKVTRLSNVLSTHCSRHKIDFMSIDTEGHDFQVLQSINWGLWSPTILCVESPSKTVRQYIQSKGYEKVHDSGINSLFKLTRIK